MPPADDDPQGGPFRGLPRPAAVRRRAAEADLPPPARSRDAPVREMPDDDDGAPDASWEPAMRRDPRRADERTGPAAVAAPSVPAASGPAPPLRPALLTPAQRYAGRLATGLGQESLAAVLGLSPMNGERAVRRWEKRSPGPDDRPPPRSVELLLLLAAEVPEVAAFLREQGRAVPDAWLRTPARNEYRDRRG